MENQYMTTREVAKYFDVPEYVARQRLRARKVQPYKHLGRGFVYLREDVEKMSQPTAA